MAEPRSSTNKVRPLDFGLTIRAAAPTQSVKRENGEDLYPAAFEISPGVTGNFSPVAFTRLQAEGGCRPTVRTATGMNYFLTGPSGRLTGLTNLSDNEDHAYECMVDFKRLTLGFKSPGADDQRDDDGFRLELGRLNADDTASRRMKKKGFWGGSFDFARGDIAMPLSWGAVTSYAWAGDQTVHLFKLEASVMNGGAYGFNKDLYGSLRLEMTLNAGRWKPVLAPYYAALQVDNACTFQDTDCVQQGISQSVGVYVDSPIGPHWGFFGVGARQWLIQEDAQFINDRISISYNAGLYFKKAGSWQFAAGGGWNSERDGDTLLEDTTLELNAGLYLWRYVLLKAGLLLLSGDTEYATVYGGTEIIY